MTVKMPRSRRTHAGSPSPALRKTTFSRPRGKTPWFLRLRTLFSGPNSLETRTSLYAETMQLHQALPRLFFGGLVELLQSWGSYVHLDSMVARVATHTFLKLLPLLHTIICFLILISVTLPHIRGVKLLIL